MSDRLIASIKVEGLFGLYDYTLPEGRDFEDAAILYGDNGVGKSTVLRLAFHLMSAADNRGHRTALYNAEFAKLEVLLTSRVLLSAVRVGDILSLAIELDGEVLAVWDFKPRNLGESADDYEIEIVDGKLRRTLKLTSRPSARTHGEYPYLKTLGAFIPNLFILTADRRLDSDSVSDPSDEVEFRKIMRFEDHKRLSDLVVRSRQIGLSQALSNTSKWIAKKALEGANEGTTNVHAVYSDVLQHIMLPPSRQSIDSIIDPAALIKQLISIEQRTSQLARYDLATPLSVTDFKKALSGRTPAKRSLAAALLSPYVESLEGRLKAVEPIYELVHNFVETINGFLSDKKITFKVGLGFGLVNRKDVDLEPAQLSSGEQQLLLLFCYVLTARDKPTVFMIDEPEISLNIKWQRQLVQSLLNITEGAQIQFLFASHSLELLSQHRQRVIKLESKDG
ncbi:AAA family ATPase [Pseudomonas putida]|uniref:AAA family ATPase n=1 Tax=Pseudomonas putida TaxID=303 RepID=UPI0018D5D45E|nr:AAA family ATPase [Pseudomonas putida]MBH3460239.1 ATP-binding protein [Pseudomonas putida]